MKAFRRSVIGIGAPPLVFALLVTSVNALYCLEGSRTCRLGIDVSPYLAASYIFLGLALPVAVITVICDQLARRLRVGNVGSTIVAIVLGILSFFSFFVLGCLGPGCFEVPFVPYLLSLAVGAGGAAVTFAIFARLR